MSINRLTNYQFAISQSISGSFNTNDTVEASFLAKGNSQYANNYVTQFVDLKYSVSSESISLQDFPKGTYPEQFFIGQSYTTQSFTAGIPVPIQYVQFTLTGSLDGTGSNTYNSGGAANYQRDLQLDYDGFQIKVHTPKTELTDSGLLVFTSPNKFIKANSDGIEIKGGNIEAEKITARELEVFGNTTIFGDITATANSPYNSTPNNVSSTGNAGASALFARGDHQHNLPFATLNAVAQEGEFTKISGSSSSTGSFGAGFFDNKVGIGTTSPSSTLHINKVIPADTDNTLLTLQGDRNTGDLGTGKVLIDFTMTDSNANNFPQVKIGAAVGRNADADSLEKEGSGAFVVYTSPGSSDVDGEDNTTERMRVDYSGKVGIGTTTPSKTLEVAGDISSSGNIFMGTNKFLYGGGVALLGEFNDLVYIGSTATKTLFQGSAAGGIEFGQNTSISLVMKGHITASGNISASGGLIATGDLNIDGKSHFEGNITASGDISASGKLFASGAAFIDPVTIYDSNQSENPRLSMGRSTAQSINFDVGDRLATIYHKQDESDGAHTIEIGNFSDAADEIKLFTADKDGSNKTTLMYVSGSGQIGIGTSTPRSVLEVVAGENDGIQVNRNATTKNSPVEIGFRHTTTDGDSSTGMRSYRTDESDNYDQELRFFTMAGDGGEGEHLTIKHSGKVGVGTTGPSSSLDVVGDFRVSSHITASGNISGSATSTGSFGAGFFDNKVGIGTISPSYTLEVNSGTTNEIARFASTDDDALISVGDDNDMTYIGYDHSAGIMSLGFDNGMGSNNISIRGDGKVGIGTTSPGEVLEVVGNISGSGTGSFVGGGHFGGRVGIGGKTNPNAQLYISSSQSSLRQTAVRIETDLDSVSGNPQLYIEGNKKGNSNTLATHIELKRNDDYRAAGIKITEANTTDEWFIGAGYADNGFHIGYDNHSQLSERPQSGSIKISRTNQNVGIGYFEHNDFPGEKLTVHGNISSSGTIFASKFESAGASGETIAFNDNLNVTGDITASGDLKIVGNITSSGTLRISSILDADDEGASSDLSVDAQNLLNIGSSNADEINIGRQDNASVDINLHANSSTPSIRIINKTIKTNHPITASANISSSETIITDKMVIGAPAAEQSADLYINDTAYAVNGFKVGTTATYVGKLFNTSGVLTLQADENRDIQFGDSATDAVMYIDNSAENVGIGTASPTAKLDVRGDISASGNLTLDSDGQIQFGLDNAEIKGSTSALDLVHRQTSYESGIRLHTQGHIYFANVHDNNLDFNTDTNMILSMSTADGTSKLGIGNINPTKTLTVEGDISASGNLELNGSGIVIQNDSATEITFTGTNNANITSQGNLYLKAGSSKKMYFGANNTDEQVAIDTNGNVGIGTTSPSEKLHIDGNVRTNTTQGYYGSFVQAISNAGLKLGNDDYSGFQFFKDDGNIGIGTTSPSERLDVSGNIKTSGNISSPSFESGFAGSGFRITSGSDDKYSLTLDDLTVRGSMSVFELLIHQVRATNGSLFVSNTGKIISSSKTNNYSETHREFNLFFDTGSNYGHSFVVGDLIRAQRFEPSTNGSGSQVFKSDFHIIGVNGTTSSLARLTGSDEPEIGYEYVRIGSTTNTDRQGSIYMTADDENAPFLDVVDELTAHSQFNTAGKTKVRLGKLSGITTTTFGTLPGYGFYASGSAYLEGSINATAGEIGGFGINQSSISSSNNNLKLFSDGVISGSDVHFRGGKVGGFTIDDEHISSGNLVLDSAVNNGEIRLNASNLSTGNGFYVNGNGSFRVGGASDNQVKFAGGVLSITTDALTLDSSGNLTTIGTISSSAGNIGGWTIDTDKLKKSNLFELAPNATYIISSSNFKVSSAGSILATAGQIGGFGIAATTISSSTGTLILTNTGQITASDADITGKINATSGQFSGDVIATHINTDSGSIGGFTLDTNKISSTNLVLSSSTGASSVISASKFNVKANGQVTASNVFIGGDSEIAGWNVSDNSLSKGSVTIASSTQRIRLGGVTDFDNDGSDSGILLGLDDGSSYEFFVGTEQSKYIHFDGSELDIKTGGLTLLDGNLTISGTLSSSVGNIGGWTINEDKLAKSNLFELAPNSTYVISSSNFKVGNVGNIIATAGTIGGFGLGSTTISSSTGELILKSNGQITASAVSMSGTIVTGDITATAGTIGGFTLDTNLKAGNDGAGGSAIDINPSTPSIKLGAKESIADNDSDTGAFLTDQAIAIGPQSSTQGFRVTNQGVVTASNALIRGNSQIAGFDVSNSQISSQAGTLKLKSTGQITASNALLTNVNLSGLISSSAGNIGGFKIEDDNISSAGLIINALEGAGNATPSIELGGKTVSLGAQDGIYIGKGTFFGSGHGIGIGDTNVLSATNGGGFIAASGDGDDENNVVAFGHIADAYSELKGDASYVMFRPSTGLILQHPNFSLRDGQLEISSSGNRPTSIKLSSDGATSGIEIDSKKGLIGHGDASGKILETHAGQFKFGEDTLSPDSNTDGVQYDSDGDVLNWGGSNFVVTNDGGGTT